MFEKHTLWPVLAGSHDPLKIFLLKYEYKTFSTSKPFKKLICCVTEIKRDVFTEIMLKEIKYYGSTVICGDTNRLL